MKTLVLGASGATGRKLVEQLLSAGQKVKIIVRATSNFPASWNNHSDVHIIKSAITEITVDKMAKHLSDCQSVASCLGHNPTVKGILGKPYKLVTGTVRILCEAILRNTPETPVRFVLMNTAGNNRGLNETVSASEKIITGLMRWLLPPHADNEKATSYLIGIGPANPALEWVVVRPDHLIDEQSVTAYTAHQSPVRSAIFDPGKTSRINVGHFMAKLLTDDVLWNKWKGQCPVIYNARPEKINKA